MAEASARTDSPGEAVMLAAPVNLNGTESESINVWPDETAEASFIAEARERGEPTAAAPIRATADRDGAEENDAKNLPRLDDLVKRIPAEVMETLDDLFRVKFTTVRRMPKKAFKS